MALNAFQFTGGASIAVSATPQAVQVMGPTIVVTNIGTATVYGSLGGSASMTLNPGSQISGQPVGGTGGGNTATGVTGIPVLPGQSISLAVGANAWLWLATLTGASAVNVANGT